MTKSMTAFVDALRTDTGSIRVSSPKSTVFDLVRFAPSAGHLANVIKVLPELIKKIDPQALTSVADLCATSDVPHLGYPLERLGGKRLADPPWRVIPNETIEVEF